MDVPVSSSALDVEAGLEDAPRECSVRKRTSTCYSASCSVRAYRVQVCRCRSCGKQVRGRHPDIAADQHGASAHRLGFERVKAAAHVLHYGVGIPVRRVPEVLGALYRGESDPGSGQPGRAPSCCGCGGLMPTAHAADIGPSESGCPHRTTSGWRVGGERAFLMAFEIRKRQRSVIRFVLVTGTKRCGRWFPRTMEG